MPVGGTPIGQSFSTAGVVTAPAASAVIAVVAAVNLPAGFYQIDATAGYGATAGVDSDMSLALTGIGNILQLPVNPVINSGVVSASIIRKLDGNTGVEVIAIAGSAGIYKATLVVTPVRGA